MNGSQQKTISFNLGRTICSSLPKSYPKICTAAVNPFLNGPRPNPGPFSYGLILVISVIVVSRTRFKINTYKFAPGTSGWQEAAPRPPSVIWELSGTAKLTGESEYCRQKLQQENYFRQAGKGSNALGISKK